MQITFYPIDIDYRETPSLSIRLWGICSDGSRIVVFDDRFRQYFFAVPRESYSSKLLEDLRIPGVLSYEVERKFFGRSIKALRIESSNVKLLGEALATISRSRYVDMILEDDLRASTHYMLEKQVKLCNWVVLDVEPVDVDGLKVDKAYKAKGELKTTDALMPTLRILAFHAYPLSRSGSPNPDIDQIAIITAGTSDGRIEQYTLDDGERSMLTEFVKFVEDYDPDVIVGFESNRSYWPFITRRASVNGVKLSIGRDGSPPHTSVYGHISIPGRVNLDLYDFVEDLYEVKSKDIEGLAEYLGLKLLRKPIPDFKVSELWNRGENGKTEVRESGRLLVEAIIKLSEEIVPLSFQLSSIVGLPPDHVFTAAVGFRVESHLMFEAIGRGELIPKRSEVEYERYTGAIVLEPRPGIHEDVLVLDFKSLYPSLIIKYNISPDTYIENGEALEGDFYEAPEVKHRFRREPRGMYPEALSKLLKARDEVRAKLKEVEPGAILYKILDARQKAIKIVANATYGYAGWVGARWYMRPVAEAVAAWGRAALRSVLDYASEINLRVIYGDTDSIFVEYDEAKIDKLVRFVRDELGLDIKPDVHYKRILFTEAKKRYVGLTEDGRIDFVGFEAVRGDWSMLARIVQEAVADSILRDGSIAKAIKLSRDYIDLVRKGALPLEYFIVWKTISKPLEEYKVKAPHIEAARKLVAKGFKVGPGDRVGYVIVKRVSQKLYEKAEPYIYARVEDIDLEYYIENQVLPAALRILEVLGVRREQLLGRQAALF
ncbi:MAG: DNA polymerase domain-containing protein [Nitrososphaerota archaeon]|nr:DNA polymerase II [Candidatus Bathyarchaeota archaeon]MDW8061406.1 DNA polymerase domain-containing protein [Nitrososphaerota archaeon]